MTPPGKPSGSGTPPTISSPFSSANYASYLPGYVQNTYTWRLDSADWTHVNAAQRLPNGNTVISLRNQDLVIEVDAQGNTVWSYGPLVLKHQPLRLGARKRAPAGNR